jgi:hypothetical protein
MPVREEPPSYEDPEFDPEGERLLLYQTILETMRDCDERGAIKTLWTHKYMAAVFGGVVNADHNHPHQVGLVHLVPLFPLRRTTVGLYQLYEKCGLYMQKIRTLPSHEFTPSRDDSEMPLDVNAHYTLKHTIFTPGRAAEFAEIVLQLNPARLVEPDMQLLLWEDPSLARYRLYGDCLLRMRDGLIPPLAPDEARKYSTGTDL